VFANRARAARFISSLSGHFWTIAPVLRHRARPAPCPPAEPWSVELTDPDVGTVKLRGLFRDAPESDAAVVIVHGLGGTIATHYCSSAARAADGIGVACLRLALRGADREGDDFYHAGLTADVHAALTSPVLARFSRLYVLGYSLGGHVTLRYATGGAGAREPRVRAVAAVCAPLDLELAARHIDSPGASLYRHHVLTGLKDMYAAVARRRPVPTPLSRVRAVRSIREWDELTVVPRFGFGSAEQYYSQMSVGSALRCLGVPALLIEYRDDPMVPPWTYDVHLARPLPNLEARALSGGGHVGYPARTHLGEHGPLGVESQVLTWLLRQ
jgi:predicted alpha/beta-fold hydrolase